MDSKNMTLKTPPNNLSALTGMDLKMFVRELGTQDTTNTDNNVKEYMSETSLTGEEAKEFYESLINEPTIEAPKTLQVQEKHVQRKQIQRKPFKNVHLLRMAESNDIENLEMVFSQGSEKLDVNVCDDFGWTPLMCAACSGAEEAVKILLDNGADSRKRDKLGNTAAMLARSNNHDNIIKILEDFNKLEKCEKQNEDSFSSFYCDVCQENVKSSKEKHETSTLHLFNQGNKTKTFYGIPESNKGFQLLLKKGWDKEKGLGRDGTGRKFPIKAVPKKDRTGIGAPKKEIRKKEKHTTKYENKRKRESKMMKEKEFEKKFRLEFS